MKKKKDSLRIAMLGHKRVPSREGGVEIVVEELSARMVQAGHTVTCYNRKGHHIGGTEFDTAQLKEHKGIRLISVPTLDKKGLAAMTASIAAAFRCAFGKYDVIHFHAEGPCAMLWLPKLFGKRCIATVHGLDHQRAKWGFIARNYIMLGEKCAVKFADEIIVLSNSVQNYFRREYNRDTHFIANGVERPTQVHAQMIREALGLEYWDYILYLGRIVPEKGLSYLIDAFRQVDTNKKLVIAGGASDTSDYLDELKQLAAGDDRIMFVGFVQGQLLEELYSNAYFYVLPSDLEGMPLSLMEAMSYGNCCLTSDIDECAQVIEEHGVTFRHGDTEDLREKMQMLCDDPMRVRGFEITASDFICSKYSWDEVCRRTLALYDEPTGDKHENSDDQ